MNTVTYGIVQELYAVETEHRISYGIAAYANMSEDGTATIVASVRDISSDKHQVEELVNLCNHLQLSLLHLDDVIEDFLSQ